MNEIEILKQDIHDQEKRINYLTKRLAEEIDNNYSFRQKVFRVIKQLEQNNDN